MKLLFIVFLFVSPFIAYSQCQADESPKMLKKALPEAWRPIKGDYLWMHNTEISNQGYLEFLNHVRKQQGEETYKAMLPDTLVWSKFNKTMAEPFVEYYFRHPSYRNFPVVGISYEQAKAYCEFATEAINQRLKLNSKSPIEEVLVRLPSQKEWEMAARAGNSNAVYPWGTESLRHPLNSIFAGQYWAHCVRGSIALCADLTETKFYGGNGILVKDNVDVTAPIKSYWPNSWGIYNMSGNVAEMVAEKGICKGGSWGSMGHDLRIQQSANFDSASCQVGFRPLLEVVKFKNQGVKNRSLTAKCIESSLKRIPANSFLMGGELEFAGAYWWYESTNTRAISLEAFHVWETEIPNWLYNEFLKDIAKQDPKLAEVHRVGDENWRTETSLAIMQHYSTQERFANHPVVNVNYMSAHAFCTWLTEKYNALPGKRFANVVFRLPNESEWECAARGALHANPYPWGGPYELNTKGCHLANYNPVPDNYLSLDGKYVRRNYPNNDSTLTRGLDGASLTAPVKSYHPNGYGLYNMAGNAAEMLGGYYTLSDYHFAHDLNPNYPATIDTNKNVSLVRGGSFASMNYCLLVSTRDFQEVERMNTLKLDALPTIGFRVVMVTKENPTSHD